MKQNQQALRAVRGMNDILPPQAQRWEAFEDGLRRWLTAYGYEPLRMPLVEPTALFRRAIGDVTDIVEKEMYSFTDSLNGEDLTLRPEGTASCVRAVLQHNLLYSGPKRLWYMGPMFRHERPQQGRYRQFHQLGVEALGLPGPDIDAEQIIMCARLWRELGLEDVVSLEINSLGSAEERLHHRAALIDWLQQRHDQLDADAQRRLHSNPLRILDSKNPAMQELIAAAPQLTDYLGEESLAHLEAVRMALRDAGVAHRINPRLVRGLDYYNRTVFEWVTDKLGAQATICAGGRYDGLVAQLGGKPAPACGFALGLERVLALQSLQDDSCAATAPDVYLAHQGAAAQRLAFQAAEALRDAGFDVLMHMGDGSFKAQFKRADASGAQLALVIGDDEAAAHAVGVKPLRRDGEQQRVPLAQLTDWLADWLDGAQD